MSLAQLSRGIADNLPDFSPHPDMYRVIGVGESIVRTDVEALRMYTIGSAWFSFDEDKLGSLQAGKFADLAVLFDDILELEAAGRLDDLRHVSSILTIVDGDIVYSDGNLLASAQSWCAQFGEPLSRREPLRLQAVAKRTIRKEPFSNEKTRIAVTRDRVIAVATVPFS